MKKNDNEWEFETESYLGEHTLNLNGKEYFLNDEFAALCHCVLLLVDAVNDKYI